MSCCSASSQRQLRCLQLYCQSTPLFVFNPVIPVDACFVIDNVSCPREDWRFVSPRGLTHLVPTAAEKAQLPKWPPRVGNESRSRPKSPAAVITSAGKYAALDIKKVGTIGGNNICNQTVRTLTPRVWYMGRSMRGFRPSPFWEREMLKRTFSLAPLFFVKVRIVVTKALSQLTANSTPHYNQVILSPPPPAKKVGAVLNGLNESFRTPQERPVQWLVYLGFISGPRAAA